MILLLLSFSFFFLVLSTRLPANNFSLFHPVNPVLSHLYLSILSSEHDCLIGHLKFSFLKLKQG